MRRDCLQLIINNKYHVVENQFRGLSSILRKIQEKNEESLKEYALETRFKGFNLKLRGKSFRLKQDG